MDSRLARFIGGAIGGVAVSLLAIEYNLLLGIVAMLAVGVVGFVLPRYAFLAGASLGIGGTWLVAALRSIVACQATADFCGDANFLPLLVIAVILTGIGLGFSLLTLRE